MSAFGQIVDIGDWRNVRVPTPMRHWRSPPQSPIPGFGEKYCSLSGFPSHSLESAGGAFLTVVEDGLNDHPPRNFPRPRPEEGPEPSAELLGIARRDISPISIWAEFPPKSVDGNPN